MKLSELSQAKYEKKPKPKKEQEEDFKYYKPFKLGTKVEVKS